MALAGEFERGESPYARAARDLIALGYHAIPIMPPLAAHPGGGKAPGEYRKEQWWGMRDWQRFRDRAPTEFEIAIWSRDYPDANVGIVCGTPAGDDHVVIAVDIDTIDFDDFSLVRGCLPASPMMKKGAKGLTLFYRAPLIDQITSRNYDKPTGFTDHKTGKPKLSRVADLLTGADTRQTVAPPSVHPDGPVYHWIAGPVPARELPIFDADALSKFEETCWSIGCINRRELRQERQRAHPERTTPQDSNDYWGETKAQAMARLADWVPQLGLYKLRSTGNGYRAVATWRSSHSGRADEDRGQSLSIHSNGIKDFGSEETYSPIDLVMHARSCDQAEATAWLRETLGLDGPRIELMQEAGPVKVVVSEIGDTWDAETGEVLSEAAKPAALPAVVGVDDEEDNPVVAPEGEAADLLDDADGDELPDELTHVTGLLGTIIESILWSSRRPSRVMALATALTVLGTSASQAYRGPSGSGTHLYVVIIAKTAAGKGAPLDELERLLTESDQDERIMGGPGSVSGLHDKLAASGVRVSKIDEFGDFLQSIDGRAKNAANAGLKPLVKELHAAFKTIHGRVFLKQQQKLRSPALSLFSVTTEEQFYRALSSADVGDGFLNRFLIFNTKKRSQAKHIKEVRDYADPQAIKGLLDVANIAGEMTRKTSDGQRPIPVTVQVPYEGGESGPLADWAHEIEEGCLQYAEAYGNCFGRVWENGVRLATIRAIGENAVTPVVRKEELIWGLKISGWCARRLAGGVRDHVSDNQTAADLQALLREIKDVYPKKISRRALHRSAVGKRYGTIPKLVAALDMLAAGGEIEKVDGKRKDQFFYVYRG